uniref:Uncharacterized protein n=1 Tax=Panagrolaimus sp. ES5 TaxID=591445 RepID=A0AC34G9W6_9BILA
MLNSTTKLNPIFPAISKKPVLLNYFFHRHFSEKKIESASTPTNEESIYEKPRYATFSNYRSTVQPSRIHRVADAETGIKPTYLQRWFLVITRIFRSRSEQPALIPKHTIDRMHDRMRGVYIIVASLIFFSTFFIYEYRTGKKIERDRASGKVVTKMSLFG